MLLYPDRLSPSAAARTLDAELDRITRPDGSPGTH